MVGEVGDDGLWNQAEGFRDKLQVEADDEVGDSGPAEDAGLNAGGIE